MTAKSASTSGVGILMLARDRDAWATIRGFVYQVDATISRWLGLGDQDALELERGEDIDVITTALAGDGKLAQVRVLEQVKHRQSNVTLRDPAVRSAIANFFEHRRQNPSLRLTFRFTTTASIGRERPSPLPGKVPGIVAWRIVQDGSIPPIERNSMVTGLRALLHGAEGPADIQIDDWKRYQTWLATASPSEFADFIDDFEWGIVAPDSTPLALQIFSELRAGRHVATDTEARQLYEHLFVKVFMKLSTPGIKRLTRLDLVEAVKASRSGQSDDSSLAQRLRVLHNALASRVDLLEQQMGLLSADVANTMVGLASLSDSILKAQFGPDFGSVGGALIETGRAPLPSLSEPPVAPYSSPRTKTVRDLLVPTSDGQPAGPRLIALYGAQASGKSQLGLQIARKIGPRRLWIPFFGLDATSSGERLALAVRSQVEPITAIPSSWDSQCAAIANMFDAVVFDDVPPFTRGDEFGVRFAGLAQSSARTSALIVLTSVHRLSALDSLSGVTSIANIVVPSLSAEEVNEVFLARGAPSTPAIHEMAEVVHGLTGGHPVLVQAVAEYIARRVWRVDSTVLSELFGKRFAQDVNDETVRILLQTVSDAETRSLLYRLTIADIEFGRDDLELLAKVPPRIERKSERFASIVGPWVEALGHGRYRLSQLIKALGAADVSEETKRECHRGLARRILARRRLSEMDALSALTHLTAAHDSDAAASVLIGALHSLTQVKDLPSFSGKLWASIVAPPDVSAPMRLQIHAFQLVLRRRVGEPTTDSIAAIDRILSESNLPSWAIFTSSITIVVGLALEDATLAAPFMLRALTEWPSLPEDMRESLNVGRSGQEIGIESLAWLVAGGVHNSRDLRAWVDAIAALPATVVSRLLRDPIGRELPGAVFGRILTEQWHRPSADRNWIAAARVLDDAASRLSKLDAPILEAAAIGCAISAHLEAGESIGRLAAVGEEALGRFAGEPDAAFLIAKNVAFGALDRGDRPTALHWLRIGDSLPGNLFTFDRAHVQVRLGELLMDIAPPESVEHLQRALVFARSIRTPFTPGNIASYDKSTELPLFGETPLVIQLVGELAIAKWNAGDRQGAVLNIIDAIDRVLAVPLDDEVWRTLRVRIGHASGYFLTILSFGEPPSTTLDGSSYVPPFIGMFIRPSDAATAAFYNPDRFRALGLHAMMLAEFAGDDTLAVQWAARTLEVLKAGGLWAAAIMPLERLIRDALERGSYTEAFEYGADMLTAFWANRGKPREAAGLFLPASQSSPARVLTSREEQREFDSLLLDHVFLPATLTVAKTCVDDPAGTMGRGLALRDVCRQLMADPTTTEIWADAINLLEAAFVNPSGGPALIDFGKAMTTEEVRTLRALAYLLASFDQTISLQDALYLQLTVVEYLVAKLQPGARSYERIAVPLFERYWTERFAKARFAFQSPRLVERDLYAIAALAPKDRLKPLLRTIARGLQVQIPHQTRTWLNEISHA